MTEAREKARGELEGILEQRKAPGLGFPRIQPPRWDHQGGPLARWADCACPRQLLLQG